MFKLMICSKRRLIVSIGNVGEGVYRYRLSSYLLLDQYLFF